MPERIRALEESHRAIEVPVFGEHPTKMERSLGMSELVCTAVCVPRAVQVMVMLQCTRESERSHRVREPALGGG